MPRVALLLIPLALLWLASLYGAYRLGASAGYSPISAPSRATCLTAEVYPSAKEGEHSVTYVNQLQADGYRIDRQDSTDARVAYFTLCK